MQAAPQVQKNISQDIAISVRDLVVGFGERLVLDGLDLDVRRGEILGLVGSSGGGKSVLLRTIIGLISKRSGIIRVGHDVGDDRTPNDPSANEEFAHEPTARQWGVLFQQGALFSSLTVLQNVQYPMRENLGLSKKLMDELATAKLEMVGLSAADGDRFPSELSGGMTKRAALARALALDPQIVFLDEPTSGLDPISAGDFDSLIKTLQKTLGFTVFMVTHDLDSLHTVCNRIAALADGKIVAIGTVAQVVASEHPWVKAYFRGKRTRVAAPAIN